MFSVLDDDLTTVTDAASSKEAWQALKDLYDRDTINTAINLFKNATERKLADGASLQDHLTGFHNDWIRLKDRSLKGNAGVHNAKQKEKKVSQTKPEEPSTYATAFQVNTLASKRKPTRWIFNLEHLLT